MNTIIGFDSETTGLIEWKKPSGGEDQPHIVQLAAQQIDLDTRKVIQSIDLIIKPDGWEIPEETVKIHGITTEHAMDVGVPEKVAVGMFLDLWGGDKRIAYNTTFDNRIIRIATKRYFDEDIQNVWKEGEYECAMIASKKAMGVKSVKLIDAYKHFTGKDLEGAHSAMADTKACMEIYFAMQDLDDPIGDVKF